MGRRPPDRRRPVARLPLFAMSVIAQILNEASDARRQAASPAEQGGAVFVTGPALPTASPFTPLYLIERLGLHHGTGEWRVRVHADIFSGATEIEAMGKAMMALIGDGQTINVRLIT